MKRTKCWIYREDLLVVVGNTNLPNEYNFVLDNRYSLWSDVRG